MGGVLGGHFSGWCPMETLFNGWCPRETLFNGWCPRGHYCQSQADTSTGDVLGGHCSMAHVLGGTLQLVVSWGDIIQWIVY